MPKPFTTTGGTVVYPDGIKPGNPLFKPGMTHVEYCRLYGIRRGTILERHWKPCDEYTLYRVEVTGIGLHHVLAVLPVGGENLLQLNYCQWRIVHRSMV